MPNQTNRPHARRLYPYVGFGVGAALAAGSLVFHVLAVTQLATHGLQAIAVTCVCLASVVIATTLVYRKVEAMGRDVAVMAYDVGRAVAYAERGEAHMRRTAALLDHVTTTWEARGPQPDRRWLEGLRRDLDAIGSPDVGDLEPLVHLRRIAERLHDADT